ncbi:tape measure protein [Enterococcus songbeiensis]|uniref:tape measure protein n=1 Tax=Enterococcus songbeiensis TaxID=2559927 RepID=UPI0010F81208|nr:tape measure protein [Enterococcus songbeiensis]
MADGSVTILVDVDGKEVKVLNSDLDKLTGTGKKAGSSIKDLAVSIGLVKVASAVFNFVSGAVKDLAGEAIKASDSMDKFKSTMQFAGFSNKEIEKSSKAVQDYADKTVYELTDVANTTAQLAANGVKDYQGLTEAAGNLNAVAGGNSDTFKTVAMMLTQTAGAGKLTTENWNQLADAIPGASGILQKAMKENGAYTGNFRDAMEKGMITSNEFNEAIKELGMTDVAKEAATSTATFEGAFGSLKANVVSGIQDIINAIGKGNIVGVINDFSGAVSDGFNFIVEGIQNVLPHIQNMQIAFTDTGALEVFKETFESIKDVVGKVVESVAGQIPKIQQTIENVFSTIVPIISNAIENFKANFENFGNIFSVVLPVAIDIFTGVLNTLLDFVGPAIDAFMNFADVLRTNVGEFITNELVPAIENFGTMIEENKGIIEALTGVVVAAGGAFLAFKGYLAITSIISTVSTAITVLSTAFTILSNVGIGGAIKMIAGFMGPVGWIIAAIGALLAAVIYLWNTNEGFRNAVIAAWTAIIAFLQPAITSIAAFIQEIWGSVVAWWNENQQTILTTVQMVWGAIQVAFQIALGAIQLAVTVVLTAIQNFWNTWGSAIMALVQVVWSAIQATFQSTLSTIMAVVNGVMNQIRNVINTVMGVIQGVIKIITGAIKGDWSQVWEGIKQITSSILEGIKNTISNVLETAKGIVNGKIEAIKGFFKSIGDINLYDIGKNIIQGLINGIGSMVDAVKNKISEVAGNIKDKITGALGIHSPSRWMRDYVGKFIPQGIAVGIDADADTAYKAMRQLSDGLTNNISPEMALGTRNIGAVRGYAATSQIVNNTYNTNTKSDLKQIIDAIQQRPLVVQSILDGQIIGNSVDQTNGAVLKRKFYTNGSGA